MIRTALYSLLTTLSLTSPALAAGLSLTVEGLRSGRGKVIVIVFDNARAFDTLDIERAVDIAAIPARQGQVQHTFAKLTEGPYAIFLFHDENGDEDLNATETNLLEGVGASGAPNRNDDPNFAAASVWPGSVVVRVHYDQ